jgi:hypothetical protein
VSTGSSCLGRNTGTKNVFNIVMIVSINMGDYTMGKGFLKGLLLLFIFSC